MGLTGSLDLYLLMTGFVAGSVILSLFIWALILLVTGIMGRLSMNSILIIITTFFAVAGIGFVGSIAAVPLLLWALWYAITGVINYINIMR